MDVTVYTAITAGKDGLRDDQFTDGADFIAYLDDTPTTEVWQVRRACSLFCHPNRNAKIHKVLAHQYLEKAQYSIWLDGNIALKTPATLLVDQFLAGYDLAMFSHPDRDCLYEEATFSCFWEVADVHEMEEQVAEYRRQGFPALAGLVECGVIVRRHTPQVERFNEIWWSEICRRSYQDQLSVMVAARKAGVEINRIPGSIQNVPHLSPRRLGNPFVDCRNHLK